MSTSSNSSSTEVRHLDRFREWYRFFLMRVARHRNGYDFRWLFANLKDYDDHLQKYCGRGIADSRLLEIGFGARPIRLMSFSSMGLDIRGIDLDRPILFGSLGEFVDAFRKNGWQRTVKSLVRHTIFDKAERRALAAALAERGYKYKIDASRFIIGDAASVKHEELVDGTFDLVISEDVFEHLPPEALERILERIARWLKPTGIAMIRPAIFTGITGGHLVEWYAHTLEDRSERRSEPWEHLRKNRFAADTFLNKFRLDDYRRCIHERFDILEEVPISFGMGQHFLTEDVRAELTNFSEAELLSNEVLFVVRPKPATAQQVDV